MKILLSLIPLLEEKLNDSHCLSGSAVELQLQGHGIEDHNNLFAFHLLCNLHNSHELRN